ncbi:hypothetical protein [Sandaracinus amylolyticus]|uniref:hypothetical protein n=1 Tax=Sandaracinus amylolyticus TaxID=927083 RepID=UPI001F3A3520|nr:hypothetical protein [Sandaracinus amylolyticus]UJR85294.1 Hypothetical protein I5071_73740 [Sandaracinus amylolyticus]
MSEKPVKKRSLSDDEMVTDRPMGRRSSIAVLGGAILGAAGIAAAVSPQRAEAQVTDRDPSDPAGRGRGCPGWSDSDPSDPGGCGRRTGLTDSDPSDAAGRGRGRRSCSDADPYDPAGGGRHC